MATLRFLGAAGTVTGSRHLVEHGGRRVLLDCGLFQGEKAIRRRNWEPFPVPPSSIHAVVLSHGHIDHTGYLPRLVNEGFRGEVLCTPATRDLLAIMLPDSGRLHEEEAAYARRERYSKHDPPLPLYTEADAAAVIPLIETVRYGLPRDLGGGITLSFHRAGHILGSATVQLDLDAAGMRHTLVFSGDLGRHGAPVLPDPEKPHRATSLIVESTYADRSHGGEDPRARLGEIVREIVDTKGVLLIPAFAIGRTQDVLYHLRQLQLAGEIPPALPIFLDSPMACDATPLYLMHREEHDEEMVRMIREGRQPLHPPSLTFVSSVEQSRHLNQRGGPLIILSASGMATGGRILHHLKHRLPDPRTTVLFVGYQAAGTRGRRLVNGERTIRIHGRDVENNARTLTLHGLSAHGDRDDVDRWLSELAVPPVRTYCVHGEASSLQAARARFQARGWDAVVPEHLESFEL